MKASLETLYWFHGHRCPMSTIGFRAGRAAAAVLKVRRVHGRHVRAVCHFRSCAIDGIQIAFPATMGNGNLEIRDEGCFAFTFTDDRKNASVRLAFTSLLLGEMRKYRDVRERPGASRREVSQAFELFVRFVRRAPVRDLFDSAETAGS